jgi:hypothetical protein
MIIEYVGSLVRPSVADSLERRHYNQVVGAGELAQAPWGGKCDLEPSTKRALNRPRRTPFQAPTSSSSTRTCASTPQSPATWRTC